MDENEDKRGKEMNQELYEKYVCILNAELVPALGCTEPIALAYAAATAREKLGKFPERAEVLCSGNIIKNVKGVKVPNSGGMKGVETAVILGIVGGDAGQKLEVLESITEEDRRRTRELLSEHFCTCILKEGTANLFIEVRVYAGCDEAVVRIEYAHTNITYIRVNDKVFCEKKEENANKELDKSCLNVKEIVRFAENVQMKDVEKTLRRQIEYNYAISEEGLKNSWGAQIGRILQEEEGDSLKWRLIARAAAGSDARMSGCSMPVIINSGSGNQGMTCSLPVIEYAKAKGKTEEELMRALCISNLIAQDQKRYIGALSAYCGVVCAAAGAGAALTYLCGGSEEQIENTVINTIANIGGMVCDGAKPSCAAKISSALQSAFLGHQMAMRGIRFEAGDGIVMDNAEDTVKAVGYVGKEGMKQTDIEILNLMIGKTKLSECR